MRVLLASNNPSKLRELRSIASSYGLEVVSPSDLGIRLDVEETGGSFAENALLKARAFQVVAGGVVLADDSGLVVDVLNGEPGIYSARFSGPDATDEDRNRIILKRLEGVPESERTARFVAAIAVAGVGEETRVFEGRVEGRISEEPIGKGGFGYDPIFFYPPFHTTLADVDADQKASVSHRGKAMAAAVAFLGSVY
jgi:XTP/dITP diphosphohydrolase